MQARDETEPHLAPAASADGDAVDAALGETIPQLREVLGPVEETARRMLEAEGALQLVRQRFEQTADPEEQGELAAEALEHVERQLELARERRRQLDNIEADPRLYTGGSTSRRGGRVAEGTRLLSEYGD